MYNDAVGGQPKKPRHIPDISDLHWDAFNELRKKYGNTWQDVFERFYNYQQWMEHIFILPKELTKNAKLNDVTITSSLPEWLHNIHKNFIEDAIKDVPDISEIKNINPGTSALIIGAGPSVDEYNHLHLLKNSAFYKEKKGIIISTAHKLKDCLDAGVVPDYVTLIDSDHIMIDFIDHDIVREHCKEITGIFSVTIDPDVLSKWGGKRHFFLLIIPDLSIPNVQAIMVGLMPTMTEFDSCAHDGGFAWNIARYMGCNTIALIGLDLSYKIDTPVKETPYYGAFRPSYNTEKDMMEACYRFHTHSFFGVNCYTDFCYDSFMEASVSMFKSYKENHGIRTINCTGSGIIDDPEIENMLFEDWIEEWE